MKKTTLFIFGIVAILSLILSSIFVAADTYHIFENKNELLMVENHKIVLVDVTNDNECIFTIDGEGKVIWKDHKDGTKDVTLFVKKAFAIRTKTNNSVYCEAFIDVKAPKETEKKKEIKVIISPNTSAANAQQASQEINIINVSEPNAVQEITPPVEEIKVKKGVIQRIVEFLKNFFK
ncbi:hypothetical protein J4434_08090 [Candidatus Woesearchaeota archaeon]|nr:hypothetical protein [Candidatus Woesearchaeota archaeon]